MVALWSPTSFGSKKNSTLSDERIADNVECDHCAQPSTTTWNGEKMFDLMLLMLLIILMLLKDDNVGVADIIDVVDCFDAVER